MRRNTALGIVLILAVIAGIILYAALRPEPARAPGTSITLPATGYTEHAKYYDINANYASSTPLLQSAGPLADATARSLMLGFVRDTIQTFKNEGNFDTLSSTDIKMMGFDQGRKEKLQIAYLIASSAHTVSYIFTIYEDTLGAHGNAFFKTFTFNTKTGAALGLNDVFSSSAYLDTLSSISRAQLPSIIGDGADTAFIKGGTTPEAKNFENFFFDNNQFVILFAPYAVAPYSAGPQTLRIPVSELSGVLKPAYP
ncbi:DUF3298 domain-containing protein [Patescibacteria group bacterium]|nr:DUF3298 domain-containing protein [Patescibacteria group bacterium]